MKTYSTVVLFVVIIAATLACNLSGATPTPYPTSTPYPTFTPIATMKSEHILFEDNFDNGSLDKWTIKTGTWNVVDGQLLCVSSHDARIIAGDEKWGDYNFSVDVKSVSGSIDLGIYGRLLDMTHTYQGQLWDDKVRIKKWDGDWSDIAAEPFPAKNDTWYNLKLEFRGTKVRLYINDLLAAIVEDSTYQKGRIGLRCASNSQAYFDNIIVTSPSEGTIEAAFPFTLTAEKYTETDNVEFVCGFEHGAGWRTADWNDILAYYEEKKGIETFVSALALKDNTNYLIINAGERWYSDQRHYFIEVHNHNLPDGWLSHADIDNHYIDLGSWHGLEAQVVCYRDGTSSSPQGTATPESLKTPESPPEFTASFVGTQQCAEWPHYAVFKVQNTTLWTFQSEYLEIYDVTNNKVVFNNGHNEPFLKEGECPPGRTILPPYNSRYVAANLQEPKPGTNFAAAITLCTEDDQKGECALQIVDFVFEGE